MTKFAKNLLSRFEAVVIGCSSGGMQVLRTILKSLPHDFPYPVIIVQHLHADSDNYLTQTLNQGCRLEVKEAEEKEAVLAGRVYIAPPNYHLLVEKEKTFSLTISERVNFARPSIDVLFETAADAYKEKLIGIILTGANFDGSLGLKKIKDKGGLAIVQDPESAEVDSMPRHAAETVAADLILPPGEIGPSLIRLAGGQPDTNGANHTHGEE